MINLVAESVAEFVGGQLVGMDPATVLRGQVVRDSREVAAGDIFVAITGEKRDGHDHVAAARAAGAVLAIVDRPVDGPHILVPDTVAALGRLAAGVLDHLRADAQEAEAKLTVVAVTGSVGKTTTKDLLAALCARLGPTVAPQKSYNNEIGLPLTVLQADYDTRYLVLEMGASGPGHIAELVNIAPPDIAVVLMVGTAHLGGFGTPAAVAAAKAEILAGPAQRGGTAVLNADDPATAAMAQDCGQVVTFSATAGPADVQALGVNLDETSRAAFTLVTPDGSAPVHLALVGAHHTANALAAAAVAYLLGLGVADIADVLSHTGARSPHRMAVSTSPAGWMLLDDSYNANEDSMRAGLIALAQLTQPRRAAGGRALAVLGEMLELGQTSAEIHARVGDYAGQLGVDVVIALGGDAQPLAAAAAARGVHTLCVDSPAQATEAVTQLAAPGDVILVKGSNSSGAYQVANALGGNE